MFAYHCAQLSYTTQQKTAVIIFRVILQTIIVARMISSGGEGYITKRFAVPISQISRKSGYKMGHKLLIFSIRKTLL